MTTSENTKATQVIGKCGRGHTVRGTSEDVHGGWVRCACGSQAIAKWMKVTVSEKKCGAVCQGSTGPSCSCECGGENHGATGVHL